MRTEAGQVDGMIFSATSGSAGRKTFMSTEFDAHRELVRDVCRLRDVIEHTERD